MTDNRTKQQIEFTLQVKRNLKNYRDDLARKCGLVLNSRKLVQALKNASPQINTSVPTVEALFDDQDDRRIPLDVLAGICDLLGIQLADLLPVGQRRSHAPDIWDAAPDSDRLRSLPSPFYEGDYYCYYFRPLYLAENVQLHTSEMETQPILTAKLTIQRDGNVTRADFRELEENRTFDGQNTMQELHLQGSVHLLTTMNQISMELTDPDGLRLMRIMFPYIHLAKDVLYYKTAAVMTVSTEPSRCPLFQKMALFRRPLDLHNTAVVQDLRGILTLGSRDLMVEQARFEKLQAAVPACAELLPTAECYYVLNEDAIYAQKTRMSYCEKASLLMKLRSISTGSAVLPIRDPERFNIYAKDFQNQNSQG